MPPPANIVNYGNFYIIFFIDSFPSIADLYLPPLVNTLLIPKSINYSKLYK